eukprot:1873688-Amphidinium_carterae.1
MCGKPEYSLHCNFCSCGTVRFSGSDVSRCSRPARKCEFGTTAGSALCVDLSSLNFGCVVKVELLRLNLGCPRIAGCHSYCADAGQKETDQRS